MIALSRNGLVLDRLVSSLQKKNYILTDEGSLTKYLGVDVTYKKDRNFGLLQPFLIQRILDLISVEGESEYNSRPTPAITPLLLKDLEGEPRKISWNYRTATGLLMYLQGTTRPDIYFYGCTPMCTVFSRSKIISQKSR